MSNGRSIAAAYDSIAAVYDHHLARDRWNRKVLWRHFARLFKAGDRVLDVGCGTGLDTVFLAARQVRVTAVDASAAMISVLRAKLDRMPALCPVDIRVGDIIDLGRQLVAPYDGIVSSFAALNTVDLEAFAAIAATLVRSGGRMVLHMLSPGSLPGGQGAPKAVIRVGNELLPHQILPADEVYRRFFEPRFARRASYGLGFLVRRDVENWLPARLLDLMGRVESVIGGASRLRSAGRFFVLDLERRAS